MLSNKRWLKIGKIVLITGTPGVGKTVISKALATRLGAIYVSLTDIVKNENLIIGIDKKRDTLIADLKPLSKRIKAIICSSSKNVVVEGHYASNLVPSTLVSHVFVLRRDPEELRAEYKTRGYDDSKILENVLSEILDICLVDAIRAYDLDLVDEIDVTGMLIEDVIEEILKVLKGRRKPTANGVNWFKSLERRGRLDKVLIQLDKFEG